jgi:predicted NBD/HSP70 family sugar kinase
MWQDGGLDTVTGKTSFDYKDCDPYAKEVVDGYIGHLACGITNVANIFRPQTVLLGGGVGQIKAVYQVEGKRNEIYGTDFTLCRVYGMGVDAFPPAG